MEGSAIAVLIALVSFAFVVYIYMNLAQTVKSIAGTTSGATTTTISGRVNSVTFSNGFVLDGSNEGYTVLADQNGDAVATYQTGGNVFFANGNVKVVDDGVVYAYALATTRTSSTGNDGFLYAMDGDTPVGFSIGHRTSNDETWRIMTGSDIKYPTPPSTPT